MTTLTEGPRTGEFIISEAEGERSRDQITLASGNNLPAGRVLGTVISAATVTSAAKAGGNTGNGTFTVDATTPLLPGGKLGVYTLRCIAAATNNGTFRLEDPDGRVLGDIVMAAGAGAVADQVKGALADGSTDFVVGDGFDITVSAITTKDVEFNPAGTDGSQTATGILYASTNAASADKRAVAVRRAAEVNSRLLTWKSGATTAQKALAQQQLAANGITFRS